MSAAGGGRKPHECSVTLRRSSPNTPWGIRIVGGSDVGTSIVINRVSRQFDTVFGMLTVPRISHGLVIFPSLSDQTAEHCFISEIGYIRYLIGQSHCYFIMLLPFVTMYRWELA
jgi:hypothetical protein